MNFSKLFGALALSSFAIVAGCAAETGSAPTGEATATEHADLKSCTGLSKTTCEATKGCMEKDTSCVISCDVNGTCTQKCNTACAALDCSALSNTDCDSYAGSQCQLEKSCLVSCKVGTGCTTTCSNSCVPEVVNCAKLDQADCASNAEFCSSVPGACVVSCTVNGGCVTKCQPATCAPISN